MSSRISLWSGLIGVAATIPLVQTVAVAKSSVEVQWIAERVTVQVTGCDSNSGEINVSSGVIIRKNGNTYTVLTGDHGVKKSGCKLTTSDDAKYQVAEVKTFPNNVDLAVFSFTSRKSYPIAKLIGALSDYNLAIQLNPNLTNAYNYRGNLKINKINDTQGALADYDLAIQLDPKYANPYYNRGNLKINKLNDTQGALADYNLAIQLDPNLTIAYNYRGKLKVNKLSDTQGALADYNLAIQLDPKYANPYYNRGKLKIDKLNDAQGALADYDRAIQLNPNLAIAYNNRGNLKIDKLNDRVGAIYDMKQAAQLYQKHGNAQLYQKAIDLLKKWQQIGSN